MCFQKALADRWTTRASKAPHHRIRRPHVAWHSQCVSVSVRQSVATKDTSWVKTDSVTVAPSVWQHSTATVGAQEIAGIIASIQQLDQPSRPTVSGRRNGRCKQLTTKAWQTIDDESLASAAPLDPAAMPARYRVESNSQCHGATFSVNRVGSGRSPIYLGQESAVGQQ